MFRTTFQALALTAALVAVSTTQADTLSLTIGAYQWQQDIDGEVQAEGTLVDLRSDLGYDDDSVSVVYARLEHPIPLLPNLLVQHTRMDLSESATLNRTIEFDGDLYPASTDVSSDLDLSHTDATLYYEVLDNVVSLDLGLTLRYFPEGVSIRSNDLDQQSSFDLDVVVPMLYGAARMELPAGFSVGGDINWIGAGDADLMDYRVNLHWNPLAGLLVEGGWRSFDLDYEDDGDLADLTIDGAYAGVSYRF